MNTTRKLCPYILAVNTAEGRQVGKREIDFRRDSSRPVVANLREETWIKTDRIDQLQKGRARIGIGNNCTSLDFFAAVQDNLRRSVLVYFDSANTGSSSDFNARVFCGARQRFGETPHAALNESRRSNRVAIHGRLPQQAGTRACRPGAGKRAEDSACSNDSAKAFRLKPFRDQIGYCHRSPTQ